MSRRYANRTDANHSEIRTAFRRLLGDKRVFDSSAVGDGFADLVCQYGGLTLLVEVKTERGKLTKAQKDSGLMMKIVRNLDDVEDAVRTLKRWSRNITAYGIDDYPPNDKSQER